MAADAALPQGSLGSSLDPRTETEAAEETTDEKEEDGEGASETLNEAREAAEGV